MSIFIELHRAGSPISVNIAHIVSFEPYAATDYPTAQTLFVILAGDSIRVDEGYDHVRAAVRIARD